MSTNYLDALCSICNNFFYLFFSIGADLCTVYGISDAKDFVESYVAFSVNHLNGIEPSLDTLAEFEAKELTNYKKKSYEESRKRSLYTRPEFEAFDGDNFDDGDDVMDEYIGNTPKVSFKSVTQLNHAILFANYLNI